MDEITKVVLNYVTREYLEEGDERQITETTPLISGGIVDSFSMVSLLRFLEKKYSIHIPDEAATPDAFDTVERIVALVRRFQKVEISV
ncbi:MAG TPA: acyl carrier protein [Terriglobales bacterium]|jgi:acyl carrier protein|nr:acyl carrier protein [Terriglobales bacterium]